MTFLQRVQPRIVSPGTHRSLSKQILPSSSQSEAPLKVFQTLGSAFRFLERPGQDSFEKLLGVFFVTLFFFFYITLCFAAMFLTFVEEKTIWLQV